MISHELAPIVIAIRTRLYQDACRNQNLQVWINTVLKPLFCLGGRAFLPAARVWPLSGGLFPLGTDRGEGTPAPNQETVGWSRPAPRPVEQSLAKRKTGGRTTLRIAKWVQLHGGLFIRKLVWNTQKAKLERRAK